MTDLYAILPMININHNNDYAENHRGRIKGGLEMSLARASMKRRACQLCGGHGHNRRTCDRNKNSEDTHNNSDHMALSLDGGDSEEDML